MVFSNNSNLHECIKTKILSAAADLIIENGLQSSMAAIAKKAGIAVGSLYNYFESKEEMVVAIFRGIVGKIQINLINRLNLSGNYKEDFFTIFTEHALFIKQDTRVVTLFNYFSFSPYINNAKKEEICDGIQCFMSDFLQKGQDEGFVTKSLNSYDLKKMTISALHGFFQNWSPCDDSEISIEEVFTDEKINSAVQVIWNMVSIEV